MTPSDALSLARKIAGRYRMPSLEDDLASIACLRILEEMQEYPDGSRSFFYAVGSNGIRKALRGMNRMSTLSIHDAVTELIEEWKRAPVQEEMAIVSEVRRIASKALTPPQLDVVMARSREETHRQIAIRRRWSLGKAVKLEQDGMAALCDAVDDD